MKHIVEPYNTYLNISGFLCHSRCSIRALGLRYTISQHLIYGVLVWASRKCSLKAFHVSTPAWHMSHVKFINKANSFSADNFFFAGFFSRTSFTLGGAFFRFFFCDAFLVDFNLINGTSSKIN